MELTVGATATRSLQPERGVLTVRVEATEPDRNTAREAVNSTVAALRELAVGHCEWVIDRIDQSRYRPLGTKATKARYVYVSRVPVTVTFDDLDALNDFVSAATDFEAAELGSIEWSLHEEHERQVLTEIRAEAAILARDKALVYAQALGFTAVTPIALSDTGSPYGAPRAYALMAGSAKGAAASDPTISPDDVELSATITAQFTAT